MPALAPENMSDAWISTNWNMADEFKKDILQLAGRFPHVFLLRTNGFAPPDEAWARYKFDEVVDLWVDLSHPEAIEFYKHKMNEKKELTMTKALTTKEQQNVKHLLSGNIQAINSVLPKHLTPEKMLRMAYSSICLQPKLARCTQLSLMNAVIEASSVGLEIGGPLSLAHLVPFKNHGCLEAKLMVDYKGYIELMYKSPKVKSVSAHPVYKGDDFGYNYGLNPNLWHTPAERNKTREKLIYAYCVVHYVNGGYDFEVVDHEIAMKAKNKSAAKDKSDSPWNTSDEHTMWVKTAIRRIANRVPKSPELIRAMEADTAAEEGKKQQNHVINVGFESIQETNVGQPETPPTENLEPQTEFPPPKITSGAENVAKYGMISEAPHESGIDGDHHKRIEQQTEPPPTESHEANPSGSDRNQAEISEEDENILANLQVAEDSFPSTLR